MLTFVFFSVYLIQKATGGPITCWAAIIFKCNPTAAFIGHFFILRANHSLIFSEWFKLIVLHFIICAMLNCFFYLSAYLAKSRPGNHGKRADVASAHGSQSTATMDVMATTVWLIPRVWLSCGIRHVCVCVCRERGRYSCRTSFTPGFLRAFALTPLTNLHQCLICAL